MGQAPELSMPKAKSDDALDITFDHQKREAGNDGIDEANFGSTSESPDSRPRLSAPALEGGAVDKYLGSLPHRFLHRGRPRRAPAQGRRARHRQGVPRPPDS